MQTSEPTRDAVIAGLKRLLMESELDLVPDTLLIERAIELWLAGPLRHRDALFRIAELDPRDRDERERAFGLLYHAILEDDPGFDVRGREGEAIAREIFEREVARYVAGETRPWPLFRTALVYAGRFGSPPWLGEFADRERYEYTGVEWDTPREKAPWLQRMCETHLAGRGRAAPRAAEPSG